MLFKIKTMTPHAINLHVFNRSDIHVYHFVYHDLFKIFICDRMVWFAIKTNC